MVELVHSKAMTRPETVMHLGLSCTSDGCFLKDAAPDSILELVLIQ